MLPQADTDEKGLHLQPFFVDQSSIGTSMIVYVTDASIKELSYGTDHQYQFGIT